MIESDEDRYRLLIEAITDYAIYMLDPSGRVVSWNPGAQRFKGYAAEEVIGEHFSRFYTDADKGLARPSPGHGRRRGALRSRGLAGAA